MSDATRQLEEGLDTGNEERVREALAAGADPNWIAASGTPGVILAVEWGHGIVEVLLKAGANPNAIDRTGDSALIRAAHLGKEADAIALLRAGANPNAPGHRGVSALMHAAGSGSAGIIRGLLAAGAHIEEEDDDCWRALHVAAMCGNIEAAEELIRAGADIEARTLKGETPEGLAMVARYDDLRDRLAAERISKDEKLRMERKLRPGAASKKLGL